MEAEWVLGIAVAALAAASGVKMANGTDKVNKWKWQEQAIMDEFVLSFLPEVMGFYQLEVLGKDPFSAVDREQLIDGICKLGSQETYRHFDRNGALYKMQAAGEQAKESQQELLQFLFWYLDFSNAILKDRLERTDPLIRETMLLEKQFAVWCICHEELQADAPRSVPELIHHSSYFAGALKDMEAGVFRELMADDELRNERRGNFVRIIFQAFEKEAQGQVELDAIEQFHEHFKKHYTDRNKGLLRF